MPTLVVVLLCLLAASPAHASTGYGSVTVTHVVTGEATDRVTGNPSATVTLSYTLPAEASAYPGWRPPGTLSADGRSGTATMSVSTLRAAVSSEFPSGTRIALDAVTRTTTRVAWGTPVLTTPEGASVSEIIIGDGTSTTLTLTSTALFKRGTFFVRVGAGGAYSALLDAKSYRFTYVCDDPEGTSGEIVATRAQNTASQVWVPLGTVCTVTQDMDAAQVVGYDLDTVHSTPRPAVVEAVISSESSARAALFWNLYVNRPGRFSVSTTTIGADLAADSFTYRYTCLDAIGRTLVSQAEITVPGDGSVVLSPEIEGAATCTITADTDSAAREGYDLDAALSSSTVTIGASDVVPVTATLTYTRIAPDPTAEATTGPSAEPTAGPSAEPSAGPTAEPSAGPSAGPTAEPSAGPSAEPSAGPSAGPSAEPSAGPSAGPSAEPSAGPSADPTAEPSAEPGTEPTAESQAPVAPEAPTPSGAAEHAPATSHGGPQDRGTDGSPAPGGPATLAGAAPSAGGAPASRPAPSVLARTGPQSVGAGLTAAALLIVGSGLARRRRPA
ncbi:DUF5979 domain-containing protein [Actinomyces howellii]|uniref:PT repeat n=1 Tax=Actinomyces howellii TaxID=52771 RepID=A0A448HIY8_9ACTO|nr:DUF5979 domain-containing protein [Actinomyces howellii]VEG29677.1 PT repeat [Actinomyces howellii]